MELCCRCEPGFDGGLEQRFMLEVIDVNSAVTVANVSSSRPVFIITGLARYFSLGG